MPNLYGDIMSDGAAGLIGGLGLAPSGCYGEDYAYFESAHGTAPDIAGKNIINPTATILSAAMLLDYLAKDEAALSLGQAVARVYTDKSNLTADQDGSLHKSVDHRLVSLPRYAPTCQMLSPTLPQWLRRAF